MLFKNLKHVFKHMYQMDHRSLIRQQEILLIKLTGTTTVSF